jgi:adenylyl-sulfate kinase
MDQKPQVLWFTGLSGAGKSTIATALEKKLLETGIHTFLLDGDNLRTGLCKDLAFDPQSRIENIRRAGEVSKILFDAGLVVLATFISPFKYDRKLIRNLFEEGQFIEIFVNTPLDICQRRDPKGLYKKALRDEIKNFSGISSIYEPPENPEITIETHLYSVEQIVDQIFEFIKK